MYSRKEGERKSKGEVEVSLPCGPGSDVRLFLYEGRGKSRLKITDQEEGKKYTRNKFTVHIYKYTALFRNIGDFCTIKFNTKDPYI